MDPSSEPAHPTTGNRSEAQPIDPSEDDGQSDKLPITVHAEPAPDDLLGGGATSTDDDDEYLLSESDIDEETELLIQQELRSSQTVHSGSLPTSPVPPLPAQPLNPLQSLEKQSKFDPVGNAPQEVLSVESAPQEECGSTERDSTNKLKLPDMLTASVAMDLTELSQSRVHADTNGDSIPADLTPGESNDAVLQSGHDATSTIDRLYTEGPTPTVLQPTGPSVSDMASSSPPIPISIPVSASSNSGEQDSNEDQKYIEELDAVTPQIISAAQHKSDLLFKLEQSALLLAAERRAALETTTRFHSCRRELATLSSSAETQLRVRLEVERDRTTAFTLRSAYQIAMLKRFLAGVASHKLQSEAAREVAITRTDAARQVLPGLLERLREAEEYVNGLEAAYRQELDRGALLRQRIEDLETAERAQREENARRAHLKSWQMGTEMLRQLAVKPVATASQAAELGKSATNVNAGNGANEGEHVDEASSANTNPVLELDMSAFDDLKLVRAKKLGIGELRGLERCNNTYAMDLSENCIENLGFLSYAPKLKLLNLSNNRIIDTSILEDLSGLMWLNLSYNPTLTQLVLPTQFFFLVILDVSYCSLDGIPELNLPVLSHLNVSGNRLAELRVPSWLPLLQTLLVEENGIQVIWPMENVPLLEILSLRNNRVHDPVELLSLATCPKLRAIKIDDNEVLGHPRMWIVHQLLPQLPLDMSLALKPPTDPIKLEDEVYRVLLSSLYHRYNLTKDPLRPGDDEILNRVLKDAEGLSKRMGNIHTYFKDVMTILHTDDSEPTAEAPSSADASETGSSGTTSAIDAVESTASREANAYSQLTALCRLCLDGNLPDVSHAIYHRARAPLLNAFMPLHAARLQAQCRGFLVRHWVVKAILAVVLIQRAWRDYLIAKAHRILMARISAATRIQAIWRGFRVRRILDFIRGQRDVHTPPIVEQDHELEDLDELLNLGPEKNLDQLLTAESMSELNRTVSLLNPLMSRSASYNLLGLPRSQSFDRSRSGSLNALHSSRSNTSLSASRSKSGSSKGGLEVDGADEDGDEKSGHGQHGRGRVGFKLGGLGLRRANADASGANARARRQTSELAVKHVGRQYNGLAYGLGAQMASMLGAPATIDVVGSRKDGSETVKLIKLRKKQMEAFAKHVMGPDPAPVPTASRPHPKPTHPPSSSPSKSRPRAPSQHASAPQLPSPKNRHAAKTAASTDMASVAPNLPTGAPATKPDEQSSIILAPTAFEDVATSSAPDAVSVPLHAPTQASKLDEPWASSSYAVQIDFRGLEDSNLSTFISTQPNLIEALEVPEGSLMHWIRTLRKSSVHGSRQPTPASLLASVAASRSRMASQQKRGSTSGSLPPPSPLPLPEGDEEMTSLNHKYLRETVTELEVPDETELAAFTDMLSTNVLEKIRKQLASQAARDADQPAPAPIQYVWENDLDAPIKRVWANEPERDVDIRPIRTEVELIKLKLAAKLKLSRRKARSRSRNRNGGHTGPYHPGDVVLPFLPPSALVVAAPPGSTKAASDEVAVDREAIMHIIKYGTPIRLP